MKMDLEKEEYGKLLDILAIADWVVNSTREAPGEGSDWFTDVVQKVLSQAKDFQHDDLIQFSDELKLHVPTPKYDEESNFQSYIEEYNNSIFWTELAGRLSERDFIATEGIDKINAMPEEQKSEKMSKLEEKYMKEFMDNNLDNIVIPT